MQNGDNTEADSQKHNMERNGKKIRSKTTTKTWDMFVLHHVEPVLLSWTGSCRWRRVQTLWRTTAACRSWGLAVLWMWPAVCVHVCVCGGSLLFLTPTHKFLSTRKYVHYVCVCLSSYWNTDMHTLPAVLAGGVCVRVRQLLGVCTNKRWMCRLLSRETTAGGGRGGGGDSLLGWMERWRGAFWSDEKMKKKLREGDLWHDNCGRDALTTSDQPWNRWRSSEDEDVPDPFG